MTYNEDYITQTGASVSFFKAFQQRLECGDQVDLTIYEYEYEQLKQELTARLTNALTTLIDTDDDISYAIIPLVNLGIFQFYNAQLIPIQDLPDTKPTAFQTIKPLALMARQSWLHHAAANLEPSNAFASAKRFIEAHAVNAPFSLPNEVAATDAPSVDLGFTLGMTFSERLAFNRTATDAPAYFKGEPQQATPWSMSRRLALIESLAQGLNKVPSRHNDMASLLAFFSVATPTYLLESFSYYYAKANRWANAAKLFVFGIEFQNKPDIALTLAVAKARGRILVGCQHGGVYGQTDNGWYQRSEYDLADYYITWGHQWSQTDIPLPTPRLSRLRIAEIFAKWRQALRPNNSKDILVVPHLIIETLQHSSHSPSLSMQEAAFTKTLTLLEPAVRQGYTLTLRFHPFNKEAQVMRLIPENMRNSVHLYRGKRGTLGADGHRYHTTVFTTPNATGIAECIQNDINFRIICVPEHFSILPPAQKIYAQLQQQGIWLQNSNQVEQWLEHSSHTHSKGCSAVNTAYKQHFARSSRYYVRDWVKALESLL